MRTHLLVFCAAAIFVAGTIGTAASAGTTNSHASVADKTLVVDLGFVLRTLDPHRDPQPTGAIIFHQVYDTLLSFANGDVKRLVPNLASSWTASKDQKRFVFDLRKGVRFSDGTPLTAADVVFSLKRLKFLGAPNSDVMAGVTVTARGSSRVILTSGKPYPSLPSVMAFEATGIVNSKKVMANGGSASSDAATADRATAYLTSRSEGSGPYMLSTVDLASQIILTANPNYRGAKPAYTRIVLRNVPQAAQQRLDIVSGSAQVALDLGGDWLDGLPADVYVRATTPDRVFLLHFNMDPSVSSVTANQHIRQAVRYALDYTGIRRLARGVAIPLAGIIPPAFPGGLPAKGATKQDLAKARSELAASGVDKPSVSMAYIGGLNYSGVSFDAVAQKIKSDLDSIGIEVKLSPMTQAAFNTALLAGKMPLVMTPRRARYVDISAFDFLGAGRPFGLQHGYTEQNASPAVVTSLQRAAQEADPVKRLQGYSTWQKQLLASGPYVPIFATRTVVVADSTVTNLKPVAVGWKISFAELGSK